MKVDLKCHRRARWGPISAVLQYHFSIPLAHFLLPPHASQQPSTLIAHLCAQSQPAMQRVFARYDSAKHSEIPWLGELPMSFAAPLDPLIEGAPYLKELATESAHQDHQFDRKQIGVHRGLSRCTWHSRRGRVAGS